MQSVCFRDKLISIKVEEIPTPVNLLIVEEHGLQKSKSLWSQNEWYSQSGLSQATGYSGFLL